MATGGLVLAACCRAPAAGADAGGSSEAPEVPEIAGSWQRLAAPPQLEQYHKPGVQAVDFTLYPAADGTWQLISCVRGTAYPGAGRLLYRWEGKRLTDSDWAPKGIFRTADVRLGHAEGKIQAPHCVKHDGKYYLFYSSSGAHCLVGEDGKAFTDHKAHDGQMKFFDMPRDLMIFNNLDRDGLWYAYFTDIAPGKYAERKNHTVGARTARRLEGPWSAQKIDVGVVSPTPADAYTFVFAESPFVLFRNGWYYRFEQMNVLASRNPRAWQGPILATLTGNNPRALLAPEIVTHDGRDYIAGSCYSKDKAGIYLAAINWRKQGP
jgi:beta-xylosidase